MLFGRKVKEHQEEATPRCQEELREAKEKSATDAAANAERYSHGPIPQHLAREEKDAALEVFAEHSPPDVGRAAVSLESPATAEECVCASDVLPMDQRRTDSAKCPPAIAASVLDGALAQSPVRGQASREQVQTKAPPVVFKRSAWFIDKGK